YVEVLISQPQTPLLSALFMSTGPTITTRAVAQANTGAASTGCVVALNAHASRSMDAGGSGTLTFNSCALYANSDASDGIYVGGSGTVNAQYAGDSQAFHCRRYVRHPARCAAGLQRRSSAVPWGVRFQQRL